MNAEKLHDAIGLLPSDLITETDRLRCAKPRVIPWKRYAAMAACFAVVLGCSMFAMQVFAPKGATEAAAEAPAAAAPREQAAPLAPAADAVVSEESAAEAPAVNGASGNSNASKDSVAPATREPEETVQDTSVIFCQRAQDICLHIEGCRSCRSADRKTVVFFLFVRTNNTTRGVDDCTQTVFIKANGKVVRRTALRAVAGHLHGEASAGMAHGPQVDSVGAGHCPPAARSAEHHAAKQYVKINI